MISPHITIPYLKIGEHLSLLQKLKINLEIYFNSNDLDHLQEDSVSTLKESLDYRPSISVHAPYMDLSPGAVDREIRNITERRFLHTCAIAEELGARYIVFHSGFEKWKYALNVDIWLSESIKTWEKIMSRLSGTDIRIVIENVFEDEPSNLNLLMEAMGSEKIGLCFDTGHFNLFSKIPLVEWIDETREYVVELHLHDNDGKGDQHRVIGEGTFPFKLLFKIMKGKDCLYTIEAHSKDGAMKSIECLNSMITAPLKGE